MGPVPSRAGGLMGRGGPGVPECRLPGVLLFGVGEAALGSSQTSAVDGVAAFVGTIRPDELRMTGLPDVRAQRMIIR